MGTDSEDDVDDTPWFAKGLRFTCTQCGNCCTGEPGYVWLNREEMTRLAEYVGVSLTEFEELYVKDVGVRKSLRELKDGSCVFYRPGKGCTVYPVRPRQCRSWPFWDSNLRTPEHWETTCENCPGAGKGKLFTLEEILEQTKLIRI